MTTTVTLHIGDVRDVMATLPDDSVNLIVTSPPFLALRSYLPADHPDKHREIGSEPTPATFLDTLLELTGEWRRILHPSGSLCVEIGDTYSGSGGAGGDYSPGGLREGQDKFEGSAYTARQDTKYPKVQRGDMPGGGITNLHGKKQPGGTGWPLAKSLCGIPTLYTWSLAYGRNLLDPHAVPFDPWRIRNLLVWTRPNPPVAALGDKFRPATSYVTVACTSDKRWFDLDAVRHEHTDPSHTQIGKLRSLTGGDVDREDGDGRSPQNPAGAPPLDWHHDNPGDDWQPLHRMPTQPYAGSHYATYPVALPRKLIAAMCPAEVCNVCGEGRRRYGNSSFTLQTELAAHIRERRTALGINPDEVNAWFGYKEIARNWERTDPFGAAVPNANDWPLLKERLGLDDRYDEFVMSRDPAHITYVANGQTLTPDNRRTAYDRGGNTPTTTANRTPASRIAPDRWTDCVHYTDEPPTYHPGTVLDPFAGSGTTAIAAAQLGRNAILIDIDSRNVELVRQRLHETVRVLSEVRDGDTWTWTVEPATAQQVAAQAAGQLELFDGGAA